MADLIMCGRHACALSTECRRSLLVRPPAYGQTWKMYGPPVGGWCESFLADSAKAGGSDAAKAALAVERARPDQPAAGAPQ